MRKTSQPRANTQSAPPLPQELPGVSDVRASYDPTGARGRWACVHADSWQYLHGETAWAGLTLSSRNSDDGHVGYIAIKDHGLPLAYIYARHGAALDAWVRMQADTLSKHGRPEPGYWNSVTDEEDEEPWVLPSPRPVRIWNGGRYGADQEGIR